MENPTPAIFSLLSTQKEKSSATCEKLQVNAVPSSEALDKNLWLTFDLLFFLLFFYCPFLSWNKGEREDE